MPILFPPFRPFYPYYNHVPRQTHFPIMSNYKTNISKTEQKKIDNLKSDTKSSNNNLNNSASLNLNTNRTSNNSSKLNSLLTNFSIGPLSFNLEALSNNDIPVFEMFGINLFLDDIIIICILIFLYKEEVKDQFLYIILFMLLLA